MPQPLTLVVGDGASLTGDLQDEGASLDRAEQNALRVTMAMRVMRTISADRPYNEADLLVLETLLSCWWRHWACQNDWAIHPFAVEVAPGTIAAITGFDDAEIGASLARLHERGLVQVSGAPERGGPRRGPLYTLTGAFCPVLPALDKIPLGTSIDRHRSDVRWSMEVGVEVIDEALDILETHTDGAEMIALKSRWSDILQAHAGGDVDAAWREDPASAYAAI